jgi:hypothetical protein
MLRGADCADIELPLPQMDITLPSVTADSRFVAGIHTQQEALSVGGDGTLNGVLHQTFAGAAVVDFSRGRR